MKSISCLGWFMILTVLVTSQSTSSVAQGIDATQSPRLSATANTTHPTDSENASALRKAPKALDIQLKGFQTPEEADKKQIEQWLLELDLVPMLADRVAFAATGTIFFGGKGNESHISNLRQFAIGWSLDNREDRERLLVINQRVLGPEVRDLDQSQYMFSTTSELDRLRIKTQYHEANGSQRLEPGPTSKLQEKLERSNTFFPTRAVTASPISIWQGRTMNRSNPSVNIDRLQGIQRIGAHTVALFEYRPADFYVFLEGIAFLDGSPVQCDSWRQIRRDSDIAKRDPTPEQIQAERDFVRANATRISRIQSIWQKTDTHAVPVLIRGITLDDVYDVELTAEIRWYVNEQVNPLTFQVETLQQLGPLAVSRELARRDE
jgi:hypothetical protein